MPGVPLEYNAVLVTHRHRDHFDDAAADRLSADDVGRVREHLDDSVPVVADHMEAINHCLRTREDPQAAVDGVTIPEDREAVTV